MRYFLSLNLLLQIVLFLCGVEVATSCLRCFTTPADRARICTYALSAGKMEAVDCLQRLHRGFGPLDNIQMAYSQMHDFKMHLKTFEDEVKKINASYLPPEWLENYELKMEEFVKALQDRAARNQAAACRPPCGFQKAARTFKCDVCAVVDCQLPVTCPINDMTIIEMEKTFIPCFPTFDLDPEKIKVTWKYAKNIKVTDLSYFKELRSGEDRLYRIDTTRVSNMGTYVCEISDEEDDIILRSFFYLDVIRKKSNLATLLEESFKKAVLSKTVEEVKKEKEAVQKIKQGPSTMDNILAAFHSKIAYAIYGGVFFTIFILFLGCLWDYASNVDW